MKIIFLILSLPLFLCGCFAVMPKTPEEQYNYGKRLENNWQEEKAFEWYQKAASQGHAPAQYELGRIYEKRAGEAKYFSDNQLAAQHMKNAFNWYMRSSIQGHTKAQLKIFYFYLYGYGVEKNFEKAFEISKKLVKEDDISNVFCFAELHREAEDYNNAFYYYSIAASKQHARSLFWMGMYYEDGVVVAKNLPKALEYYDKAMKLGDFDAKDSFNNLQDNLHPKRNRPAYTVEWQDVLTDTEKLQFKKYLATKNPDPVPMIRYLNADEIEIALFFSYIRDGGWQKPRSKTEFEVYARHDRYNQTKKTLKKRTISGTVQYGIFYSGIATMPDYSPIRKSNLWRRMCSCRSHMAFSQKCKKCQMIE